MEQAEQRAVYLGHDVLRESFSYLSVRDILRNRMLSRDFNSMLMETSFVNLQLSRSVRNKILVEGVLDNNGANYLRYFEYTDGSINDNNIDIYKGFNCNLEGRWLPVTSCNGIVCCIRGEKRFIYKELERPFIYPKLFRKLKKIHRTQGGPNPLEKPRQLIRTEEGYRFRFVNPATRESSPDSAFLASKIGCRNPLIGFGFDHIHSAYKLVVLLPGGDGRTVITRIFDLALNSWRTVNQNFPGVPLFNVRDYRQNEFIKNGAFLNGTLNWLASRGNKLSRVSFDLAAETYTRKNLPRDDHYKNPNIGVLNNRISFTYFSEGGRSFEIWMQEQEDNDNSWMHMASIGLQELSMSEREYNSPGVPLLLINICDRNTLVLIRTCNRNKMVFYNFNEHAVVGSHTFETASIQWVDDSSFVESLVSPI